MQKEAVGNDSQRKKGKLKQEEHMYTWDITHTV